MNKGSSGKRNIEKERKKKGKRGELVDITQKKLGWEMKEKESFRTKCQ